MRRVHATLIAVCAAGEVRVMWMRIITGPEVA